MLKLSYFKAEDTKIWFTLPKSYYNTTISLFINGDFVNEVIYSPCDIDREVWIGHHFTRCYPEASIELIKNYFGHKGIHETNLFYLHPAKCGGSSIERAGYEYGIRWARHHPSKYSYHHPYEHTITHYPEIIKDKALFTSVRNPYTRMVSAVYCPYNRCNSGLVDTQWTLQKFNEELSRQISLQFPVYDFVYYKDTKVVPHVLKLENLTSEFNQLMFDYNSEVKMEKHVNKSLDFIKNKKFGVKDISKENLSLINDKFVKDFIYFDYKIIN
jgi:hypothetical protein